MRIGINATFACERHNGITTFVDGVLRCLHALHHEAYVYSSSDRYAGLEGVTLRRTPASLADGKPSAATRRFAWMQTILPGKLRRDHVDLFLAPSVEALLRSPVPQIVTVHDLIPLFYPSECPRQRHYYKRVLPHILRNSLRVLVVSQHTRQDVIEQYGLAPDQVSVVYNSLREELFNPGLGTAPPPGFGLSRYFLFVGTFAPRKNLETVIRAFARVHPHLPEKLVVVAYPDRWQESSQQLARELGVLDKMVFYSGLKDSELTYLYRHATALVLLSEYEGFGFPPLEAMATGTPAIVSDSTSLAELAGDGGVTVGSADVVAAGAAMQKLSADSQYRRLFGRRGELKARQFTWTNASQQLSRTLQCGALPLTEAPLVPEIQASER
ncbi:MAG: glycosyltransferase family 1 protein [Candidatus Korobacteraceae bacterium]